MIRAVPEKNNVGGRNAMISDPMSNDFFVISTMLLLGLKPIPNDYFFGCVSIHHAPGKKMFLFFQCVLTSLGLGVFFILRFPC